MEREIARWELFFLTFVPDIKIIGINFMADTSVQQEYIKNKIAKAENPVFKSELEIKHNELKITEVLRTEREYYLMFFSETEAEHDEHLSTILNQLGNLGMVEELSQEKKKAVLFKYNNPNTAVSVTRDFSSKIDPAERERQIEKRGYDPYLMDEIQPQGGLNPKGEKVISLGDGYMACIYVYGYSSEILPRGWLYPLMRVNGVISTMDISPANPADVKRNLKKSMKVLKGNYRAETRDDTAKTDFQVQYNQLQALYDEIRRMEKAVKLVHTRLYVSARTKKDLEIYIKKVLDHLDTNSCKGAIMLNEELHDYEAFFKSFTQQKWAEYKRPGKEITASGLAKGHPYDHSGLMDPLGTHFGWTLNSKGALLFDMFYKDKKRKSYNSIYAGMMGAGKSTFLKKLLMDAAVRGNFIRGFDVTGEFKTLVEYLGGKIVSLDGTDGILNALEVLETGETEQASFAMHISKLTNSYRMLAPECDSYEAGEFENLINSFYEKWGLIDPNNMDSIKITGRPSNEYPTWSDFLEFVELNIKGLNSSGDSVQEERMKTRIIRMENIRLTIESMVKNYGAMVDGHTSINDIYDEQIVMFNIKNLVNMKPEMFDFQINNAILLCYENAVRNGTDMWQQWEKGQIKWEDITRFLIVIDEAHRIVNTQKLPALKQMITISREARKFFAGIALATQSIRDFVPEDDSANIDSLKLLFELSQYKIIMQQDSNTLDLIKRIFDNQLNEVERQAIPRFNQGEALLCISGVRNLLMYCEISDREKGLYEGGA